MVWFLYVRHRGGRKESLKGNCVSPSEAAKGLVQNYLQFPSRNYFWGKKVAREVYLLRERTWSGGKRRQAALYFERGCV